MSGYYGKAEVVVTAPAAGATGAAVSEADRAEARALLAAFNGKQGDVKRYIRAEYCKGWPEGSDRGALDAEIDRRLAGLLARERTRDGAAGALFALVKRLHGPAAGPGPRSLIVDGHTVTVTPVADGSGHELEVVALGAVLVL